MFQSVVESSTRVVHEGHAVAYCQTPDLMLPASRSCIRAQLLSIQCYVQVCRLMWHACPVSIPVPAPVTIPWCRCRSCLCESYQGRLDQSIGVGCQSDAAFVFSSDGAGLLHIALLQLWSATCSHPSVVQGTWAPVPRQMCSQSHWPPCRQKVYKSPRALRNHPQAWHRHCQVSVGLAFPCRWPVLAP